MTYKNESDQIFYGGDYNPEQWPQEVWAEDIRMMKKAHINIVTLNVFSWAALQPDEDTYCFERLDKIMEFLRENGMKVCLATSTGAHPAWMAKRHPDILRTEFDGRKRKFGGRHNSCPNSPTYRLYAPKLAGELARRYRGYDNLVAWHVSNEYGGDCYCDNCAKAFRVWLKKRYGTLDEVNKSFNTAFWGHTFYDWDEIELPNLLTEHFEYERTMFQGISLDYKRFFSESMLECYQLEYDAIREVMPDIPITTNLMGTYKNLDYKKWAPRLDFISWDNYPRPTDSPAATALCHDLMRGLKEQAPFVLMEQTPSVQNWQPYNRLKRPGEMRLLSYQAAAHGADAIQFFQIRRSIGACEKFHGAVIDHAGRDDTRVFLEVEQLGAELEGLHGAFLEARTPTRVAIVFDWENWWAVEYSAGPSIRLKYLDAVRDFYSAAFEQNVPVDMIGPEDALAGYRVVIAPLLYMTKPGFDEAVRAFVRNGGIFITTYFSGIVDEHDLVLPGGYPGKLRDILGIWVEENDALMEGERNHFDYQGRLYPAEVLCDLLHTEGAQALGTYQEDFYRGMPALTRNSYGKGAAYYVATRSDPAFYEAFLKDIFHMAGIRPVLDTPAGVEATLRRNGNGSFLFLLNHNAQEVLVELGRDGEELLSGEKLRAGACLKLEARGVAIVRSEAE